MKYFFDVPSNFDCNFIVMQKEVKEDELKEISEKKYIIFSRYDSSEQAL